MKIRARFGPTIWMLFLIWFAVSAGHAEQKAANSGRELGAAEEEASTIWQAVLTAKGGKDRLHEVENFLRSSTLPKGMRVRGKVTHGQHEQLFVPPDRYWEWSDERPTVFGLRVHVDDFTQNRAFHGVAGVTRFGPVTMSTAYPGNRFRFEPVIVTELLESAWVGLRPLRSWSEGKGKSLRTLIECSVPLTPAMDYLAATITFTLDSNTHLPEKAVFVHRSRQLEEFLGFGPKPLTETYEFFDYVDVAGIQMPSQIRHRGALDYRESVHYQFNVKYDPRIFDLGPSFEDGPEGWQKRGTSPKPD